ncbi:hypothetical protein HMPREF1326_00867 [Akkermansia sp. KLE1605]|nr:hypothetical protein HMPREF1326_00867 [Akkermansia sp. KLE1605]
MKESSASPSACYVNGKLAWTACGGVPGTRHASQERGLRPYLSHARNS